VCDTDRVEDGQETVGQVDSAVEIETVVTGKMVCRQETSKDADGHL
jgi:hypothetical protein